ncbi:hypothetical protein Shyhy02_34760 [Streptomyces hygroscopicus subsp. hygroscopicus]|nr:hypothetical protein Shyhy02_34760 [Streptomyces hygroscopicus subsp. hygroscopicus]
MVPGDRTRLPRLRSVEDVPADPGPSAANGGGSGAEFTPLGPSPPGPRPEPVTREPRKHLKARGDTQTPGPATTGSPSGTTAAKSTWPERRRDGCVPGDRP